MNKTDVIIVEASYMGNKNLIESTQLESTKKQDFKNSYELFKENAQKNPDSLAITTINESISYKDLDVEINNLAEELIKHGIGKGTKVTVLLGREKHLIVSLISLIKVGAIFIPIDNKLPKARVEKLIGIAESEYVLSDGLVGLNTISNYSINGLRLYKIRSTTSFKLLLEFDSLSYIIFTSGSSGNPKAVAVSNNNLMNALMSFKDIFKFSDDERMLFSTSIGFDISLMEILLPLISGATIVLYDKCYTDNIEDFRVFIDDKDVSFVQATPSGWEHILENNWKPKNKIKLVSGGEKLKKTLNNKLLNISRNSWNAYGPTETTIWSSIANLKKDIVHIGMPIKNTFFLILNENLDAVSPGETGELYILGDGVASGYYNSEINGKSSFMMTKFRGKLTKTYKTGDEVKYDNDGNICFLGRNDRQIKVNGNRIELNEIESIISECPFVLKVSVQVVKKISTVQIVAFVSLRKIKKLKTNEYEGLVKNEIVANLKHYLPIVMHPNKIHIINDIPLNSAGKIDCNLLLEKACNLQCDDKIVQLDSDEETLLADIWKEILGVEITNNEQDFFEVGGNSLRAAILCSKIRKEFSCDLKINDIIMFRTIKKIVCEIIK